MKVHNIMEVVVRDVISKYKNELHLPCTCERCLNDVLAMTLNHVTPQYVVDEANSAYIRAVHEADRQGATAVLTKVAWAAGVVGQSPRCDNMKNPSE
ncbi:MULTISPECIES: late competence development ComFB family protein [unclassified Sporosarcina]|uniref:late competence development ComFB family protein n=1 Tax=unclassified Sporosarcina TaxID=2647733 RepID=UPI000C16EB8F|nr:MULTISPECIES: late competence development ComFB family protein [unclassified Sporosarcina]PID04997.1 competence protein ComFB [Sporosarcina sp. P30]PID07997.1 competence protein ComFB [Sporosarcina sp. P31]PID11751.1 competence protein ComFB [Sporosarcina sp. P32b]